MRFAWLPLIVLAATGCLFDDASPQGRACTDLYTEGGLTITVTPMTAASSSDRFRIEVDTSVDKLALEYGATMDGLACVQPCEQEGSQFLLSQGLAGNVASTSLVAFITDKSRTRGPSSASLRIYRNGTLVHSRSVTPTYRTTEPNGPGCGEVSNADVAIALP
jgi:hypothetical protein